MLLGRWVVEVDGMLLARVVELDWRLVEVAGGRFSGA